MKHLYCFILYLLSFQIVEGQCPAGDVNLDSQTKVDDFIVSYPSCSVLPGSLRVAGNVTNLNGLQNITSINGGFLIEETTLTNLAALSNLKTVNGDFRMQNNGLLASLNGLEGLTSVTGSLMIIFTNVTSLSALENLTSIGKLDLYSTNLTNLAGLESLTTATQGLNITYNSLLTDLSGIENLDYANPYVYLAENPLLSDCATRYVCESSLPTPGVTGSTIRDNAPGCASKTEVLDICMQEGSLPVSLKDFHAKKQEKDVRLIWNTTLESDSKNFEIQRSNNGRNWIQIGAVVSNGNSDKEILYTFTDRSPLKGSNFYRLKMVDLDETFAYSRIVNISIDSKRLVDPYPNPVSDKINLGADLQSVLSIEINNASGKKYYMSNSPEQEINVKHFPTGMYLLKVRDKKGNVEIFKFVKQ